MTKNNLLLVLLAVALAVVYAIWFTDWFRPAVVKISHTVRDLPQNHRRGSVDPSLIFRVNPRIRLTELKVVPLSEYATNKSVLPVWHLVSDSNSVPVLNFTYGQNIGGMHPVIQGGRAEPLETNVTYRMLVSAGRTTGQHDFELK
jgi:hypothetical protein